MDETVTMKKGLTGFNLKTIALILMVLDHIEYFFAFTGKIPIQFSWLGRLSAPLFLFCVVEGFIHTHNRKRYFITMYAVAVGMGILQYAFIAFGFQRPDGFYPQNQILANYAILIIILQGIEWIGKKKWVKGVLAVLLPTVWPFIVVGVTSIIPSFTKWVLFFHCTFFPMHTAIVDGGTAYIFLGVLLYLLRNHRKAQVVVMFLEGLLYNIGIVLVFFPEITFTQFFSLAYEWMSAFAAIFIIFYNGKRGKGSKKFFYWFYPGHVYVLFALSWILYLMLY